MLTTNKLTVPLIRRYPRSVREAIKLQSSKYYYNARPRGSDNHPRRECNRRYLSSDKDKTEISLEEVARSLSQLTSQQQPAMELIKKLSPEAQRELAQLTSPTAAAAGSNVTPAAAVAANEAAKTVAEADIPPPTYQDLKFVALAQAIPFLGFGFMDNAILIIAGDAIDTSLGTQAEIFAARGEYSASPKADI